MRTLLILLALVIPSIATAEMKPPIGRPSLGTTRPILVCPPPPAPIGITGQFQVLIAPGTTCWFTFDNGILIATTCGDLGG